MNVEKIDVVHYMRLPRPGLHSIERIFSDVREELRNNGLDVRVRTNMNPSKGLLPRLEDAWAAARAQGDVNHVTGDVHYISVGLDPARTILTIHDCVGLHRFGGPKRALFKLLWYQIPLLRCRWVTVVSGFTKRQLIEETGFDPKRIKVIYPNLSSEFSPIERYDQPERIRVLQIGTTENKNIERLAQALSGLPVQLTVVGSLGRSQRDAITASGVELVQCESLSREEVVRAYAQCDIVAFVSTYEGFGLPIIEAQAIGRPVVTSNLCSMPEVAGVAACLVDPTSVESIRDGFKRIISSAGYREWLVSAGYENVRRFELKNIACQYAELYRSVAVEGGRASRPRAN